MEFVERRECVNQKHFLQESFRSFLEYSHLSYLQSSAATCILCDLICHTQNNIGCQKEIVLCIGKHNDILKAVEY